MSGIPAGLVLARLDELDDPCAIVALIDGDVSATLIVTRRGGTIAAYRNRCPHAGYPLQRADGRIVVQEGRYLVCGAHGASFTLSEGVCAGGPCNGESLERVAIEVRGGLVLTA